MRTDPRRLRCALVGLALAGLAHLPSWAEAKAPEASPMVATWRGGDITRTQFQQYLDRVRLPGYRPASAAEARRLLDRLVLERLAEQALASTGEKPGSGVGGPKQGSRSGLEQLAESRKVSQGQLGRDLLQSERVEVDDVALASFVVAIDGSARPPVPPPLAAARAGSGGSER